MSENFVENLSAANECQSDNTRYGFPKAVRMRTAVARRKKAPTELLDTLKAPDPELEYAIAIAELRHEEMGRTWPHEFRNVKLLPDR